ncbi:hypothetical protein LG943_11135 [Streptomonospora sp. S1-112]|uniref:Uncharacterized protein n=2 Tax=Streptomonospora mangrovi TaxID=2883123 RepID=A0A9X3NJY0_9ACTN|nr:hypothetical protein [Streptomonospora mangrovi]
MDLHSFVFHINALLLLYLVTGALLSWRDARGVVLADPDFLCSDPCRQWHQDAFPGALDVLTADAWHLHVISGVTWPISLKLRCGCIHRATKKTP